MLKKVMITCIALSFVFIGGIAFASGNGPKAIEEVQEVIPKSAPGLEDVAPTVPEELTTDDPETEITEEGDELEKGQQPEEPGEAKEAEKGGDDQK